jgi:CHAD domain-containing protein
MKTTRKTEATTLARRLAPLSLCEARTALKYLHALMAAMAGVWQAEDRERVYRMRIASRRLRSVLPLRAPSLSYQTCARWRKQLRRVTRVLEAARDTDVQIACVQQFLHHSTNAEEHAGVECLLLRLEQRRQALQGPVVQALERFAASRLTEEIEKWLKQVVRQSKSYGVDNRQPQRAPDYQEFVTFWDQLQAQGIWRRLRQTLAAPRAAAEAAPDYPGRGHQ